MDNRKVGTDYSSAFNAISNFSGLSSIYRSDSVFGFESNDLYMAELMKKFPSGKFSIGTGFDTLSQTALSALGPNNIMIDPDMFGLMASSKIDTLSFENNFGKLLSTFDALFGSAGGNSKNLSSWGTFLDKSGTFNSWATSFPPVDNSGFMMRIDSRVLNAVEQYKENFQKQYNEAMTKFNYEQAKRAAAAGGNEIEGKSQPEHPEEI